MPTGYVDDGEQYDDEDPSYGMRLQERLARLRDDNDERWWVDDDIPIAPVDPVLAGITMRARKRYRVDIVEIDQGFYWHLYRDDMRVNGGLSETWPDASRAARSAITMHAVTHG